MTLVSSMLLDLGVLNASYRAAGDLGVLNVSYGAADSQTLGIETWSRQTRRLSSPEDLDN